MAQKSTKSSTDKQIQLLKLVFREIKKLQREKSKKYKTIEAAEEKFIEARSHLGISHMAILLFQGKIDEASEVFGKMGIVGVEDMTTFFIKVGVDDTILLGFLRKIMPEIQRLFSYVNIAKALAHYQKTEVLNEVLKAATERFPGNEEYLRGNFETEE